MLGSYIIVTFVRMENHIRVRKMKKFRGTYHDEKVYLKVMPVTDGFF